jgi:beta-lactamase regulating signal transducer with metallopeptidase domain
MTDAQRFGVGFATAVLRAELGWLLTYGVHAAIAAVVAETLVRLARPSAGDQHRLWKMALFLPLVTASAAVLFGGAALGRTLHFLSPAVVPIRQSNSAAASIASSWRFSLGQRMMLAAGLTATAALMAGASRFAMGFARLRRRLKDRSTAVDPRVRAGLARISRRFAIGPIELSESAQLSSPIAVGARDVWFPAGSTASLTDDEIDAVLAHELAHLERRDPAWFFLAGLVQAALWIHPFIHRVVARLRSSAEIACDERAVAATGNALSLARGLSRFAHAALGAAAWMDAQPAFGGGVHASHILVDRVRRLVATAPGSPPSRAGGRGFQAAAAVLALAAIASVNLNVTFSRRSRNEAPDLAAASQRAGDLTSEEARLQAEMNEAQVVPGAAVASAAPSHLLQLEQNLRHVREERAWLERSVSTSGEP